jgi:signal transduction histidine kinase
MESEWIGEPAYLVSLRDITERKQAHNMMVEQERLRVALEKERELSELKSRFVSMISHELRTPLATILTSSDVLKRYKDRLSDTEKTERIERIQKQVSRLTDLMEDVLTISRAESVGLNYHPAWIEIEPFCREIVGEMQFTNPKAHHIRLTCGGDPPMAYADPKLLRQAMMNLLSNAIKYSPSGSTIFFDVHTSPETLTVRVRDQGIGIPPDDHKRLFQIFHRGSNVGSISGTGMGLAIVKYITELHSGTVTVDSKLESGTTFTLYIPMHTETHAH